MMKNTALTLLTGLTLATAVQAGSGYIPTGKEIIPPPPQATPGLWSWFAGGSGGYVSGDWDEDIYTLHFGAEFKCPDANSSHSIYLEVGYTDKDDSFDFGNFGDQNINLGIDTEIIPLTLNYKYESKLTGNLNWYVGAGAGIALYDIEVSSGVNNASDSDTVFYGHIFAGLVYNISESFEVFGGVRYIFMDDPDIFTGPSPLLDGYTLDEDLHFELGLRFNF